jgi:hypothetical protein
MAPVVYMLGTLVTLACGILLLRGYGRARQRLLLWSGLCFLALAVSNLLLFLDLVVFPNIDLYRWRLGVAVVAMMLLLFGLIWEGD